MLVECGASYIVDNVEDSSGELVSLPTATLYSHSDCVGPI